jgi:hypothetical protein
MIMTTKSQLYDVSVYFVSKGQMILPSTVDWSSSDGKNIAGVYC